MAKKRSRKKGTGSVITVRKLSGRGIGSLKNPSSGVGAVVPPLVGGGLAGASTVLIEHLASPTNGETPSEMVMKLGEYAPYVGAGVGALGSVALFAMVGAPQGAAAMAGAIGVGGSLIAYKLLRSSKANAGVDVDAGNGGNGNGMDGYRRYGRRTGAVVPQTQPYGMSGRRTNTGAIVMEPVATRGLGRGRGTGDPRGETVTLGNVNPSAFGTPGFQV